MKYIITIIGLFLTNAIYAQNLSKIAGNNLQKGDSYYRDFAYSTAVGYYQDALMEDSANFTLRLKIGDCFRKLNNPDSTEKWYSQVLEVVPDSVDAEYYLHYGSALSNNQKYDKATIWFEKYREKAGNENRVNQRLSGLKNIDRFFKDSIKYEVEPLLINSEGLDFSPAWYDSGIVFVSNRKADVFTKSEYSWDKSSYLDLFYSDIDSVGQLTEPRLFNSKVNTKYHEGPVSFYDNFQKVVFTRNNYHKGVAKKSKDGTNKLKLFFAEKEGEGWVNIESFQYNDDEHSIGHPSIAEDGQTLYFVSDMPGGYGGTDIYVSDKVPDGWSSPRNLGSTINTEGNEVFPFAQDGSLYFASNGHSGLGGLDVYQSEFKNGGFSKPENLGNPINSSYDDFGFIISETKINGYFSTNRDDKVNDNIYSFKYDPTAAPPEPILVKGKVIDNHFGTVLGQASVQLMDSDGNVLQDTLSTSDGEFAFLLEDYLDYKLIGSKRGFHEVNSVLFDFNNVPEEAIIKLEPPHHVISIRAINKETKEFIPDADIHVINIQKNEVVEISQRGSYHHEFETKGGHHYTALAQHPDYFYSDINNIQVGYDHEYDTLTFDIPLEKIVIGKAIKLNNIYYDVNKADIRPDAAKELDKLVDLLTKNPKINIELSSHTDSRGRDAYNQSLSQRRAESAVAYIIENGISSARITAKGYGEQQLVNECGNGVACGKEKHQENRRTEFKVTSVN